METTELELVQIVHREMALTGVMMIANGLMNNVNKKVSALIGIFYNTFQITLDENLL